MDYCITRDGCTYNSTKIPEKPDEIEKIGYTMLVGAKATGLLSMVQIIELSV